MRLIYKKISCIVLSLAIVFSFMPWINADSINIHASTSEGLESWNVSATGVNSGTTRTYDLTLEKKVDNEYVLYIPDDILCTANKSSISIYSPIKSEEFEVTYTSFDMANASDVGKEKTVKSNNGSIILKDYANFSANNRSEKYVYADLIKVIANNNQVYNVSVKPYSALNSISIKGDKEKNQRPLKQINDNEYFATVVKGETYQITASGFSQGKELVTVDGDVAPITYTAGLGEKNFVIELTSNRTGVETRDYKLKLKTIDKDYYPKFNRYTELNKPTNENASISAKCTQFDDFKLTLNVDNVNEDTVYRWYHKQMVPGKGFVTTLLEEDSNVLNIDTTRAQMRQTYYCEIANIVDDIEYKIKSNNVILNIDALKVDAPEPATVSPNQAEYVTGEKADRLVCIANGTLGGKLTYKWYVNKENKNSGGELLEETQSSIIPRTNEAGTLYYYCEVWDTQQGLTSPKPAVSNCAKIVVKPLDFGMLGEGTAEKPYIIKNYNDFETIKKFVEQGNSLADVHFLMGNDITLPEGWNPIGKIKGDKNFDSTLGIDLLPFSGVIDGGNHKLIIREGEKPLFNYVRDATIKNLNIYGKKIDGNGLINNFSIDYGTDGIYNTGVPTLATIDNVTLLKGSSTLKSGFASGGGSGGNLLTIRNSRIEDGVIIGYDKKQSNIGSFAGSINGSVINCISSADVYGVNSVGGLVGAKGQSMGICSIVSSSFAGNVHSTGSYAGGIIARGYDDITAPNTPVVTVSNCFVSGTVTGVDYVGGILGAEPTCEDCWSNGVGGVYNSCFYGDVKATDGANIGAVIGFLRSYNKYQNIADNTYEKGCGADRAIGKIQEIIDTNHPKYGNHGIEPGSFDADSGGILVDDIKNDDVVFKLNNGSQSLKNWIKSDSGYPILSKIPVAYKLVLDGEYKTDYFVGDSFDSSGMVVKAIYSDGTINSVSVDEVEISGFDTSSKGVKTVKISYGVASTIYKIRVVETQPKDVSVSFTLYGDKVHKSDLDGYTHTLKDENLEVWIPKTTYTVNSNSTVKEVIAKALEENKMSYSNPTGNYIESITYNGITLAEFTNGPKSGWMYTLNGSYPNLGVAEQFVDNGDEIIFHYTDDYTKEEGSDKWKPGEGEKPPVDPDKPEPPVIDPDPEQGGGEEKPPVVDPDTGNKPEDKPSDKPADKPAAKPDTDKKPASPQTGDESEMLLLGIALLASAGAFTGLVRKKRQLNNMHF